VLNGFPSVRPRSVPTVEDIDRVRARSFGAVAAEYAEYRPGYPRVAVEWALRPVLGGPRVRLLDLGAGTGKLTAALLEFGEVVAVEPDEVMLAELRSRFPDVEAHVGTAEQIPVGDSSVDAVLVGQAWHWFDHDAALAEIARVLRPGGVLAVLWNGEDGGVGWIPGYRAVLDQDRTVPPARDDLPALPGHPAFTGSEHTLHPNPQRTTTDAVLADLATRSWILIAEPERRAETLGRVRDYLATRPETSSGEFELPLVTDVLRALRK
jgi:SAM-dependent methyltransferase